jgi:hypothetical protein
MYFKMYFLQKGFFSISLTFMPIFTGMNQFCQNCNKPISDNYCAHCGQRAIANQRLSWKEIFSDFADNVLNLDKGFFFTFWKLLVSPGKVGRNFLRGERKKYTSPIRYLIIAVAIQAFIDYWLLEAGPNENPDFFYFPFLSAEMNSKMAIMNHLIATKYAFAHNLSMIIIFPAIFYVIFRRLHYRYIELLTVNFYYFSSGLMIVLILLFFSWLIGFDFPIPAIIFSTIAYVFWSSFHFFKDIHWAKRVGYILLSLVLFMLMRVFLLTYFISIFVPIENIQ